MFLLKLLLSSSLIFIANSVAKDETTADSFRLQENVEPIAYKIEIYLDVETGSYTCKTYVHFKILRETKIIKIYHSASVLSLNMKLIKNGQVIITTDTIYTNGSIEYYFAEMLSEEYIMKTVVTDFTYYKNSGILNTSYINEEGHNSQLFVSRALTTGARNIFPCWDEPSSAATFKISVCNRDSYYTVLSNTAIDWEEWIGNYYCKHFGKTRKMPPYLVGILIQKFKSIIPPNYKIRCRYLMIPYLKFANNVIKKITYFFQNTEYSSHNPNSNLEVQYAAIPYPENSLENWRLVLYSEAEIIYDKKFTFHNRIKVAHLVARGVTYQWVGNHVSPSWWSHMWINEGITTLLAAEALDKTFQDFRMMDLFVVEYQHEALRLDTDSFMKPLVSNFNDMSQSTPIFSFSYYIKAPCIMRMLKRMLTDEVFHKGVHEYMSRHKDSSANLDDFLTAMENAYSEADEKKRNISDFVGGKENNLAHIMVPWIQEEHYPILYVTEKDEYIMGIRLINAKELRDLNWIIPVTVATKSTNYNISTTVNISNIFWLKNKESPNTDNYHLLEIKTELLDNWIVLNIDQIGYYRVNYDTYFWSKIAACLYSNYTAINVLNRAQIIDDAFFFLRTKEIHFLTFFRIAIYLWQETDYIAWFPLFKAFEYMSTFFPFDESAYLKVKMTWILNEFYNKNPNISYGIPLTESLMIEIARWRCTLGSSECMTVASTTLIELLQFPDRMKPLWKYWTYCSGLMMANESTWFKIYHMYKHENRTELFQYLSCSKNNTLIITFMEKILSGDVNITDNDYINNFHVIVTRHARYDVVLEYLLTNLERIKPRLIDTSIALTHIINHVYLNEQLVKIMKHVQNILEPKRIKSFLTLFKLQYAKSRIKERTQPAYIVGSKFVERVMRKCLIQNAKKKTKFIQQKIELRLIEISRHQMKFENFKRISW